MAGIKINDPSLLAASVSGQNLIPTAVPGSDTPQVITVNQLFLYLESMIDISSVPTFSTSQSYNAPDLVKYQNVLYRFTSHKNAGVWDSTKVVQTSLFAELQAMRSGDNETVNVTVSAADNQLTISGLTVTLNVDGVITTAQTDSDGKVTFSIPKGAYYNLSLSDQQNYYHLPSQSFRATYNERYVVFNYIPLASSLGNNETVNVCLIVGTTGGTGVFTEAAGSQVQCVISGGSTITATVGSNGWASFDVPLGSSYTINFPQVSGYSQPQSMQFTASMTTRYVMSYYAWYIGSDDIAILANDGVEYSIESYDALTVKPTGIAIHVKPTQLLSSDSGMNDGRGNDFYIDVNLRTATKQYLNSNATISTIASVSGSTSGAAATDCHYCFKGRYNTSRIIAWLTQNTSYASAAITYCTGLTLVVGDRTLQGFNGEFGQYWAVKSALTSINAALALTSGLTLNINSANWWSSTQYVSSSMWNMINGSPTNGNKTSNNTVLPLFA